MLGHAETLWQVSDDFDLVPVGTGTDAAFVYRARGLSGPAVTPVRPAPPRPEADPVHLAAAAVDAAPLRADLRHAYGRLLVEHRPGRRGGPGAARRALPRAGDGPAHLLLAGVLARLGDPAAAGREYAAAAGALAASPSVTGPDGPDMARSDHAAPSPQGRSPQCRQRPATVSTEEDPRDQLDRGGAGDAARRPRGGVRRRPAGLPRAAAVRAPAVGRRRRAVQRDGRPGRTGRALPGRAAAGVLPGVRRRPRRRRRDRAPPGATRTTACCSSSSRWATARRTRPRTCSARSSSTSAPSRASRRSSADSGHSTRVPLAAQAPDAPQPRVPEEAPCWSSPAARTRAS